MLLQQLEQTRFFLCECDTDTTLSLVKSCADLLAVEQKSVKSLGKLDSSLVEDEAPLLHADYVLGSIRFEDLADKF